MISDIIIVLNIVIFSVLNSSIAASAPNICARILMHISELLAAQKGDGICALRSGPSSNSEWMMALNNLRKGETQLGIDQLLKLRECWSNNAIRRIRAARHLETAAQIFVMQAVQTRSLVRNFSVIKIQ